MASSGSFETNTVGGLGSGTPNRFKISWSVDDQSISGNYTDVNWNIRGWGGTSGYWVYKYGSSVTIEGSSVHSSSSQVQMFQNSVFASGTKRVYHNSAGECTLNISANGKVYYNSTNTSGSGAWSLPTIPRQADITSAPNFTDEQNPVLGYSNPAGNSVSTLQACIATTGGTVVVPYRNISKTGSSYTFNLTTEERDDLRALTPNSKTVSVRFYVKTVISGDTYYDYSTKTLTIVNGEPTFTTFTHRDANSATEAITGDDQYYIQGRSEVEVTILGADKAVAIKEATMNKYTLAVSSLSEDVDWEASDDIVENIGVLNANANVPLSVSAIDSRAFARVVQQTLNVLPYVPPEVTATAQRDNNFETNTAVHIEGVISRLTISGDDKNDVNSTNGVQYRYKKTTDVSWGSWTDRASSVSSGAVSTTDFDLSLDRNFAWNMEVKITDVLSTTTVAILVPVGIPIMRIGLDGFVYNNEQPLMPSHIGQVITSTALTTAGAVQAIYGGTWVLWGAGRTVVGVDTGQTEFDTVEETGGAKTHTHVLGSSSYAKVYNGSTGVIIKEKNGLPAWTNTNVQTGTQTTATASRTDGAELGGSTDAGSTLAPYITAYMWKRTA